jgi:hypothetical protein
MKHAWRPYSDFCLLTPEFSFFPYFSLCAVRLQAVSAPVGSMAVFPSSMYAIFPSLSTTKVERLAIPAAWISTP